MFSLFVACWVLLRSRYSQGLLRVSIVLLLSFSSPDEAYSTSPGQASQIASPSSTIYVRRIILSSAKYLSKREQRKLLAPYLNSFLPPASIQQLIDQLRAHYIQKGYPTVQVRAVLDASVQEGILKLEVIHGFIEQIRLGKNGLNAKRQLATAFPFVQGGPLYLPYLEQGIDQLNSVPSSQATMTILPGELMGGSIIQINNPVHYPWRIDIGMDNLGEEASGELRGKVNLALDNLLSLNDTFTFHCAINKAKKIFSKTRQKEVSLVHKSFVASFSFPVGAYNFSSTYNTSRALSPSKPHLETYLYETKSSSFAFQVKRILFKGKAYKTFAQVGITSKDSASWLEDTFIHNQSRKLHIGHGSLSYTGMIGGGQTTAKITYHQGLPFWGALQDPSPTVSHTPKAQFKKVNLELLWGQHFRLPQQRLMQYQLQYVSQHSKDCLFGSEQLSLAGLEHVRGLANSLGADQGFFMRQELTLVHLLAFSRLAAPLQPFLGLDGGYTISSTST